MILTFGLNSRETMSLRAFVTLLHISCFLQVTSRHREEASEYEDTDGELLLTLYVLMDSSFCCDTINWDGPLYKSKGRML